VFGNPAMVGWSILAICLPAFVVSALCYALAWRNMARGLAQGTDIALLLRGEAKPG
jgi:hypothetical protein